MTRLIDADALCAQMVEDAEQMDDPFAKMFTYAAINDVKHAPTVDAIQVAFIFDKMRTINAEYVNIQRLMATEPETVEIRIGIATNLLREYNALRNLIREWEGNKNGKTD